MMYPAHRDTLFQIHVDSMKGLSVGMRVNGKTKSMGIVKRILVSVQKYLSSVQLRCNSLQSLRTQMLPCLLGAWSSPTVNLLRQKACRVEEPVSASAGWRNHNANHHQRQVYVLLLCSCSWVWWYALVSLATGLSTADINRTNK
jgi:hypothetical protein